MKRWICMKDKLEAYIYLTLAMFISGSAVVVSKMMVNSLPTFLATELGIAIGLIILIPFTFAVKKEKFELDFKTNSVLLAQAVCGVVLYRVFTFCGLKWASAASSGLITSVSPVLVVVFAYLFLKEKLYLNRVVGVACVFIGIVVINGYTYFTQGSGFISLRGNMLIMAAVICEALFSVLSKVECKPMTAIYRTTVITLYAFIGLLAFAVHDGMSYNIMNMGSSDIFCVTYYGVFVSFLSYVFWFKGIEKVSASNAAAFTSVVPISSILLSIIVLKEHILISHIIGLVLILLGIFTACLELKQPQKQSI